MNVTAARVNGVSLCRRRNSWRDGCELCDAQAREAARVGCGGGDDLEPEDQTKPQTQQRLSSLSLHLHLSLRRNPPHRHTTASVYWLRGQSPDTPSPKSPITHPHATIPISLPPSGSPFPLPSARVPVMSRNKHTIPVTCRVDVTEGPCKICWRHLQTLAPARSEFWGESASITLVRKLPSCG